MTRHANTVIAADDPAYENSADEWNAAHATPVVSAAGNHTIVASDAGKCIRVTAAGTVSIGDGVLTVGQEVTILADTTGTVDVGVTGTLVLGTDVKSRDSAFTLAGDQSMATLYCYDVDLFNLSGDLV